MGWISSNNPAAVMCSQCTVLVPASGWLGSAYTINIYKSACYPYFPFSPLQDAADRREVRDLERRSYAEAVAAGVPADNLTMQQQSETYPGIPHTTNTGTTPLAPNPSTITLGPNQEAPLSGTTVSPERKMGVSEVEEAPVLAGAPAGPDTGVSAVAAESPRKRSFFGSIKKALAPGGSSSRADA